MSRQTYHSVNHSSRIIYIYIYFYNNGSRRIKTRDHVSRETPLQFRRDYILNFNEMATEKPRIRKPRNSLCKQLAIRRRRSTIRPCFLLLCEWLNNFLIQHHKGKKQHTAIKQYKGKKLLCRISYKLNFKRKSLRVYACISGQLTAPWNRRIWSNFQIWFNRAESFPQKWRLGLAEYRFIYEKISNNRIASKCRFWGSKFKKNLEASSHKMKQPRPITRNSDH